MNLSRDSVRVQYSNSTLPLQRDKISGSDYNRKEIPRWNELPLHRRCWWCAKQVTRSSGDMKCWENIGVTIWSNFLDISWKKTAVPTSINQFYCRGMQLALKIVWRSAPWFPESLAGRNRHRERMHKMFNDHGCFWCLETIRERRSLWSLWFHIDLLYPSEPSQNTSSVL